MSKFNSKILLTTSETLNDNLLKKRNLDVITGYGRSKQWKTVENEPWVKQRNDIIKDKESIKL